MNDKMNFKKVFDNIFDQDRNDMYLRYAKEELKMSLEMMQLAKMDTKEGYDDFKNKEAYEKMMLEDLEPEDLEDNPYEEFVSEYETYRNSIGWDWMLGEKMFYKILNNEEIVDEDFNEGIENLKKYIDKMKPILLNKGGIL